MDPDAAFAQLLTALDTGYAEAAIEAAENLADWIKSGGFKPAALAQALEIANAG